MSHLTEQGSAALAPCAYSVTTKNLTQMRIYKKEQTVKNILYLDEFLICFYHRSSNACKLLTCLINIHLHTVLFFIWFIGTSMWALKIILSPHGPG